MKTITRIVFVCAAAGLLGIAVAQTSCGAGRQCLFLPLATGVPLLTPLSTPEPGMPTLTPAPGTPTGTPTLTPVPGTPTLTPQPKMITGLAVLGDSTQDEYRADNVRGEEYGESTFNWVELLVRVRGVNLGAFGTRDEPRRSGYAFNWARSGATSDQMLSNGQHTGAAAQAVAGQVSHAIVQIGINDFYFSGLGQAIYLGTVSGDALRARLDLIADNIITAARALKATGKCEVLVAATQDYMTLPIVPELYVAYQDPVGRQRFVDAGAYLNQRLALLSAQEGLHFFDFNQAYLAELQGRLDSEGFLIVGGERIDLRTRGNEPHFGLLDDEYIHPGTVLSGLYAKVYIEAINRSFGTAIAPLSDDDILRAAGIKP